MNNRTGFLRTVLTAAALLLSASLAARTSYSICEGWTFRQGDDRTAGDGWQRVSVPHTWNAEDCDDDTPGYYRGAGWYRRTLRIDEALQGKRIYLRFGSVNSRADVYVNGRHAGSHTGGYTVFTFDVTELLHAGDNLVEVRADNAHDPDIPPLSADFTFFGGICRDVDLLAAEPLHVSPTHYGSPGVYIRTPSVGNDAAEVSIRTMLTNAADRPCRATVTHRILDSAGRCAATVVVREALPAGAVNHPVEAAARIPAPLRWDVEHPRLYTVLTTVADERGTITDEVSNPLGIRTFRFDPDRGFILNGRPVKLIGTNRHQDYPGKGYALPDEMHLRDLEQLRRMGGNFLRVSHYPQDASLMAACDRAGIVTSVEIPIVNAVTGSDAFAECCERMMTEMVLQNYNNPSVCIWAYMNEVLLRPPYDPESPSEKATYLAWVRGIAARCDAAARRLDPGRATMLPCHGNLKLYDEAGITRLPDIVGVNLYQGWYGGVFGDFERQLDRLHAAYPDKALIVTEYGADADIRIRSERPERFDFSVDYAMRYHEHYLPQILARDFVAGAAVWNLNDFYAEHRGDALPHINCKGLHTLDRRPKDTYRYYQAMLLAEPVVHICGGGRAFRSGIETAPGVSAACVKVYTNAAEVELLHDGRSLGVRRTENRTASFEVPFRNGRNRLEAVIRRGGRIVRDLAQTDFLLVPDRLHGGTTPFTAMNILLGSARSFDDTESETAWIPEKPYAPGSWGYVEGEALRPKTSRGSQPASNLPIAGTRLDPMFQTQRRGIEAFRADVPDGEYEVVLYFAELTSDGPAAGSAYLLGNAATGEKAVRRRFDLSLNGQTVTRGLDVAAEAGRCRGMIRRFRVSARGGEGITVGFTPVESETMLSAVRILKVY